MRTRTTAAAITGAALLLALVGCSSEPDDKPETKPSRVTSSASADPEAAAQACSDEVYAHISAGNQLGADEPRPDACASIPEADYLDTLLAVTQQVNENGRDDLEKQIEDAASADTE
ncbi:hypothetical protein [Streptomyces sp. OR43]|uniref:hypothetical protein n=1 Tax=Streptomyces sp. or43 TaxID=2478957 RepID=UPI0011CDD35E|nr:hypothetical protein [Streptomyces sp. or43]TXS36938.1 hypothetical protein EAO72_26500 [Streptomyces sp. or43]